MLEKLCQLATVEVDYRLNHDSTPILLQSYVCNGYATFYVR